MLHRLAWVLLLLLPLLLAGCAGGARVERLEQQVYDLQAQYRDLQAQYRDLQTTSARQGRQACIALYIAGFAAQGVGIIQYEFSVPDCPTWEELKP